MSQTIIHYHNEKISLYNKSDTDCCAESGASEYIFPDYYTLKTYCRVYNFYATLGDTTNIPIEGIGTAVYTLNGQNILARNDIYIPALHGPIYSLHKHSQ